MGINCGVAAWTTRLFCLAMGTMSMCILFGWVPGWDQKLEGWGNDPNDGQVTNPDAVILAKRQGARPGCKFQFALQIGMAGTSLIVNEMGGEHMQRLILFFNVCAWGTQTVGIPLWLSPIGYSVAAASVEVILYGCIVSLMLILLFADCCDGGARYIAKWTTRCWSSIMVVYSFCVIFLNITSWDQRFPLTGEEGYETIDHGRLLSAQGAAEYSAKVEGAHAGVLMQYSMQLCFLIMCFWLNEMGEFKPQRVVLSFICFTFSTITIGELVWLAPAGYDAALISFDLTLFLCIYGFMIVMLFVDCCGKQVYESGYDSWKERRERQKYEKANRSEA